MTTYREQIEEKTYRRSTCPHCGTSIETRSYETPDGVVFGAVPGRATVHTSRHLADGTVQCSEEPKS